MYDAEFPDGTIRNYGVNIFAQNLYSKVDEQCNSYRLLDCIIESKRDETAIIKKYMYVNTISALCLIFR